MLRTDRSVFLRNVDDNVSFSAPLPPNRHLHPQNLYLSGQNEYFKGWEASDRHLTAQASTSFEGPGEECLKQC